MSEREKGMTVLRARRPAPQAGFLLSVQYRCLVYTTQVNSAFRVL